MADQAEKVAQLPVDGVGLLRAEFMLLDALESTHPRTFIAEHGSDALVERLASQLLRITRPFMPRPVIYRSYDFRSNEFRGLRGGESFEPNEENPMLFPTRDAATSSDKPSRSPGTSPAARANLAALLWTQHSSQLPRF